MLKKFSKFLLSLLLIILTISSVSVCYAEVDGDKTKAVTTAETTEETPTEQEIHNGDLYLFDDDIVINQLVDGNVYVFGSNVEITSECQINGNLFIFANKVNFNSSYVAASTFICANSVYFNGTCYNNLYVLANKLDMTYDALVYRDLKVSASNVTLKSAIGRDVDLFCNTVDFGSEEDVPAIYGNLRYSANKEIEIPEGVISGEGSITYTNPSALENTSVTDILIGFATCIITVLVIYAISKKSTSKFAEKLCNKKLSVIGLLKAFGMGLASIIIVTLAFILLLASVVGAKLSIILILLYAIICIVAVPALSIIIANALKPVLKIEKTPMFYLILVLVSVVLYGITLIPFVGGLIGFIIKMIAIGLLIDIYIPHKELTDEEKAVIEEAKKQAKENKEKRKQEKLEAKEAKKKEKSEAKEAKKKEDK